MTEQEIFDLLNTLNFPVAYDHFTQKDVSIPFILYKTDTVNTFKADDKVYRKINSYEVDLITEIKDIKIENKLETLFDEHNIPYEKYEEYIDSEKIYQIYYTIGG